MEFSLNRWTQKVAVVTGASSGVGAAIARKLATYGIIVAGLARHITSIEELANKLKQERVKGKLYAFECDITNEVQIEDIFKKIEEELGPVAILINNAGVLFDSNLLEGEIGDWRMTFNTNVIAKCITSQIIIKQMRKHNIDGQLININSVLGHHVYDIPQMNVYPATQFAITALNETLRQELLRADSKIKTTNLCPGPTDTKMFIPNKPLKATIKRFLNPDDVADAVVYILSTPPHVQVHELIIRPVGELH